MKSLEIVKEELKAAGLEVAEETAKKVTIALCDKVLPRLAMEADEPAVKTLASGALLIAPVIKEQLLKLEDKIDGQEG